MSGFKEVGFIYLEGHGIPPSTVDNVFRKVCTFFLVGTSLFTVTLESRVRHFSVCRLQLKYWIPAGHLKRLLIKYGPTTAGRMNSHGTTLVRTVAM